MPRPQGVKLVVVKNAVANSVPPALKKHHIRDMAERRASMSEPPFSRIERDAA